MQSHSWMIICMFQICHLNKGGIIMLYDRVLICPVCKKGKFFDIEKSTGKNSVTCDKCHRYILLDWDKMTAKVSSAIKAS